MAFSSVQFLFVFLPLAMAVYYLLPKVLRNAVLCGFSLLLFAWSGLRGAALLVGLAALTWLGGLALARVPHKKLLLALLVAANLGVLGLFKYAGFAAQTVNATGSIRQSRLPCSLRPHPSVRITAPPPDPASSPGFWGRCRKPPAVDRRC